MASSPSCYRLGRILEPSWDVLAASWGALWPSWGVLWPPWPPKSHRTADRKTLFFICFSILSRSEAILKPTCFNMALFTVLVPSWAHLGAILGPSWRVLGRLVAVLGRLGANLASQNPPKNDPKSIPKSIEKRCHLGPPWGAKNLEKQMKKPIFYKSADRKRSLAPEPLPPPDLPPSLLNIISFFQP